MKVDFIDVKEVEIKSFSMSGTYDNHFEGNRQSVTKNIPQTNISEKGVYYIQPELVNGAMKNHKYQLSVWRYWEHRLKVVWYDDEIPPEMPLQNYLQQTVKNIEFMPNCEFVDLENF